MSDFYSRTQLLLGENGIARLKAARVLVIGLGGVGSYAAESLARAGVGTLFLADGDRVAPSNINRQLYALNSTVGEYKSTVAAKRTADINPDANVIPVSEFITAKNIDSLFENRFDYVLDAIDSVADKTDIICKSLSLGIPVISCMGTGNKLHPELLRVADISKTSVCPLARAVRRSLRERGVTKGVVAVYSEEMPEYSGKEVGSVSFVPSAAGLIMTSVVIRELTGRSDK